MYRTILQLANVVVYGTSICSVQRLEIWKGEHEMLAVGQTYYILNTLWLTVLNAIAIATDERIGSKQLLNLTNFG